MFDKKDTMVSVAVAESLVYEKEAKYNKKKTEIMVHYTSIINSMKNKSNLKGVLVIRNNRFNYGEPTPYFSNGIQIFTGDEVELRNGKKGVVVFKHYRNYIHTNAEIVALYHGGGIENFFSDYVTGNDIKITKHFNELTLGEEIAKGRKGATGFIVEKIQYSQQEEE